MGFLFLMTFKMHFDKLERNKKPKNCIVVWVLCLD
jgi:hypothetical protein